MSNPSKRKGTAWETACLELVQELYPDAIRSPDWGVYDKGDLYGTGPFIIECKAEKRFDLAGYVAEAEVEARNAGKPFGVAFIKAPRHRAVDGYAVMRIGTYIELMKALEGRT